jgi:Mlc titration factor MtfA (ptsG expression regulator)
LAIFWGVILGVGWIVKFAITQLYGTYETVRHHEQFEFCHQVLSERFHYYSLLSYSEKKTFVKRTRHIVQTKNFFGDHDFEITDDMRVLVSATLAQLTFGFDDFALPGLKHIQITPSKFYSRLADAEVKGLTVGRDKVMLSWSDFLEGFEITNDKLNLGLHEMAHALWVNKIHAIRALQDFKEYEYFALRELIKMRAGEDVDYLRDYAATNIEEFWACSVESFFEAPVEFRDSIPDLYLKMTELLRQDLAQRHSAVPVQSQSYQKAPVGNYSKT